MSAREHLPCRGQNLEHGGDTQEREVTVTFFKPMRIPIYLFFAIVVIMTVAATQTLPVPQAITDPKQITSKPNANVEQFQQSLAIEKLYMTRQIGPASWSPDGTQLVFVANISGR